MKALRFVGSSLDDLRKFPAEARRQAGFDLFAIQRGLEVSDWKPMPIVGPGVREIRIHVLGEWRVIYMDDPIFDSSGNVFLDLGFEPGEAAILHMRARLMTDLREYIQSSEMTHKQLSQKLAIPESRVSDLIAGKWEKFSLETLITLEARAGRQVLLELAV